MNLLHGMNLRAGPHRALRRLMRTSSSESRDMDGNAVPLCVAYLQRFLPRPSAVALLAPGLPSDAALAGGDTSPSQRRHSINDKVEPTAGPTCAAWQFLTAIGCGLVQVGFMMRCTVSLRFLSRKITVRPHSCKRHVFLLTQPCLMINLFVFEGLAATRGRDVGFVQRAGPSQLLHVIPSVPDQVDIAWRLLQCRDGSSSVAVASFYAPHVGYAEIDRSQFWQRLFVSIQTITHEFLSIQTITHEFLHVPILVAGDSKVWFPGLVNACQPRAADRQSVELIRCPPIGVEQLLTLFLLVRAWSSPCPQLGSHHFALTVTLRFNVVSAVPSPNTTLQVRSWPTLLQSPFFEVQHWVQQVNEVNSIAHSFTKADARQQLDMLHRRQQPDWWNDVCMDMLLARNFAWRERRRNPTPDTAAAFRRAKNKFAQLLVILVGLH